jgi:AcrR family transcriptional regulator
MASTPTAVRRTQAQRRSEAEQALLDAAARLFARKGVDGTSLADIGLEAGYSRGLVTHYFGSRAALVKSLAARVQQQFVSQLDPKDLGVEAILALLDAYLDRLSEGAAAGRAYFVMWGASFAQDAPLREVSADSDRRFRRGVEASVRAGQDAGLLRREVDAAAFSVAFVALLRGIGAQFVVAPDAVDLEAARRTGHELVRCYLERRGEPRGGE